MLNILALLLCCTLAHLAPAATLIGAYAILGPAHYLTEISWLHDRRYFSAKPGWLIAGVVASVCVGFAATDFVGVAMMAVAGACAAAGLGCKRKGVLIGSIIAAGAALVGTQAGWLWMAALLLLVPTLIHVFGMTGMFVIAGAKKSGSKAEWTVAVAMVAAALSFVILPCADLTGGMLVEQAKGTFGQVFGAIGFPSIKGTEAILGFTAFAYSYHYLNWFLKSGTIGWAKMPVERVVLLGAIWSTIMVAYLIDIRLGLLVSLPLSFGHVLLELPLNVAVGKGLLGSLRLGNAQRV